MSHPQADMLAVDEARRYLSTSATAVNEVLRDFWQRKREEWRGFPKIIPGAFDAYDLLTGSGKKIRAGLVCVGYEAVRGPDSPQPEVADGIYRAAGAIEILHNAFLIHDDIVDHADLRRNHPTVHRRYADTFRDRFPSEEEALAYGRAVALNFGDKGQALAQELLFSAGFPGTVLLGAIKLLSRVTAETVAGQLLDVVDVRLPDLDAEQVLRIHEFKTAHYTIMLPLLMGATLAAAGSDVRESIRSYAIPVGIAFQIQDDILGLYGERDVLGKPVDSDVKEGKKTLLFVDAYAAGGAEERDFLERAHGNPDLTAAELERVRGIVRDSGALERSEELAERLVTRGKEHIPAVTEDDDSRRILTGLADYLILRRF